VAHADETRFQVTLRPGGPPLAVDQAVGLDLARAEFRAETEYLRQAAVLRCMPTAHPDLEIPSMLDSYFDYHVPLSDLACHLQRGLDDRHIFNEQSCTRKIQVADVSFRERFQAERRFFNKQFSDLMTRLSQDPKPHAQLSPYFCLSNEFSIDSTSTLFRTPASGSTPKPRTEGTATHPQTAKLTPPKVWMGLSPVVKEHRGSCILEYRKPVAFKAGTPADPERMAEFEMLMRQVRAGSYIASATKEAGAPQHLDRHLDISNWMSEAGICTLHDLFAKPIAQAERNTLAFRDLLREVCALPRFVCLRISASHFRRRFCRVWRLVSLNCTNVV
jgi:hypothetical protein